MRRSELVRQVWRIMRKSGEYAVMLLLSSLLPALPSTAHAADFTARNIGDYGNVSVMEVTGGYDANNPDGSVNGVPRQVIATEFFKTHKDDYDFLVIFSNFDFRMPETEVIGFYLHIKNDILGIGEEVFDHSALFGSSGRLQGTIDMGNIASKVTDPMEPGFEDTLGLLSHEMLHRWGAFVRFKEQSGSVSQALLGKGGSHWSFLLDSKGSLHYGNQWQDNKNGTFTSIATRKYYSPLDLYLMGMIDKSKVPPMLLIENPAIDPQKMPETGTTISGTSRMVTIDDIIAAEGERVPSAPDSRKSFKTAFIFVTTPGTFTGKELTGIENVRNGFVTRYSILTDGKGLVQVASTPKDNLPVNGGGTQPVLIPRTLPPDINEGITWLVGRQLVDGSWSDISLTTERDTSEAVFTLQSFPSFATHYQSGLQWLGRVISNNTDYLARRIDSLLIAAGDASPLITSLASLQNPDGGWGSARNFISSSGDTALALKALVRAGFADRQAIGRGVSFLKSQRNSDGGWSDSGSVSAVQPTAAVLGIFTILKNEFGLETEQQSATTWLKQKQNPDGGFGSSPSTVHETALAVMALRETGAESAIITKGVTYLLGQQSENGSWSDSPFQTALAVRSVWQATITPDLSIKNSDITFIPERVSQLPTTAVVSAVITNLGRTDVQQAKVVLYDGAVAPDRKVGEQTLAFPSASAVTVTFSVPVPDGNSHTFHLAVDPDNLVKESDETNNSAVKTLLPELTYDFAVTQGDLTLSSNPVDIFKDVKLTARVANKGTSNAYNVQLRFFIDEPGAPFEIATITTDIPAGGAVTKEITWKAAKAGTDMPLTLQVDPQNTFTELSESNNRTTLPLTVTGATLPNLSVSHKDMVVTPNPAMERGTTNISIQVKNNGFSPAENVKVNFYNGVPGSGGVLIGSETIPALAAGQSQQVAVTWGPITESGTRILFISVDPDNTVPEIAEDDNSAFTEVEIKSLPDLTISTNSIALNPSAPKEGDTLAINITVQNSGSQDALNVPLLVKEGSTLIGTQVIARIAGHGQASVSIPYSTIGKNGTHELQVSVDAENVITELSEDNNSAAKTFSVQNANLWVSEQYISPNGDGVKDTTDFFFRLAASTKVQVQVVNRKGEAVRTFSGGELDSTAGTTLTWDGKGDNGTVVNDGEYQMKVVGADSRILGTLQVVVDTNRSPFTDAVGTNYLVKTGLTCGMPGVYDLEWAPDESRVFFEKGNTSYPYTLEGYFSMAPDGSDIVNLLPASWYSSEYSLWDPVFSEDHSKFAMVVRKKNITEDIYQLWVIDSDGKNLVLIKSADVSEALRIIEWSHDSNYIAYRKGPTENDALYVSKSDGTEVLKIDITKLNVDSLYDFKISPDSKLIAITAEKNFPDKYIEQLIVFDMSGNKKVYDLGEVHAPSGAWLHSWRNNTINYYISGFLRGINIENGNIKDMSNYNPSIFLSPDMKYMALLEKVNDGLGRRSRLQLVDSELNIVTVFESVLDANTAWENQQGIVDIIWSHDSSKLIIEETTFNYETDVPKVNYRTLLYDIASGAIKIIKTVYSNCRYNDYYEGYSCDGSVSDYKVGMWMHDNVHIVMNDENHKIKFLNTNTLDQYELPFLDSYYYTYLSSLQLSPKGRYIISEQYDGSGVCGPSGSYKWLISSTLNLTAELRITKNKSGITLKGIAADKNFAGYMLEYADASTPDSWNPVSPPSDVPVVNDTFTTWIPPAEGNFYVKLTVWDKAGNSTASRKRISWGISSSITSLYKSIDIFSPNGDGIRDTVDLHYQVLDPVHLEFRVLDESGNLVRTFRKDHMEPVQDTISWDGKDESGKVVPDGKYSIKIFDYEFFVEVDGTFPDTGVVVGPIVRDIGALTSIRYSVTLGGHATDKNLKKWSISSGEGDNPQEWSEFLSRSMPLFSTNESGMTADAVIDSYAIILSTANNGYEIRSNTIEGLVGKTYRIDAEDFVGNKKTSISNRLDEMMSLLLWDGNLLPLNSSDKTEFIPASLMRSGIHHLKGFETVRNTFTRLNLQHAVYDVTDRKEKWSDDTSAGVSEGGIITLDWDRSPIDSDISAIRLKGTDLSGKEYYSKRYPTEEVFEVLCDGTASNTLFSKLAKLEFQLLSSNDGRYANWTSVKVYDSSKGDLVPEGRFTVPLQPGQILDGKKYYLRMIGIEINGTQHESTTGLGCEDTKQASFKLSVEYPAGECGAVQNKADLSLATENFSGIMKSVEYYLQKPGELQLIQRNDLMREGIGTVALETTGLTEGSYPVKAVLRYVDLADNSEKIVEALNTLVVDRVPPEARITYPAGSGLMLCPVQTTEPEGPWFGIPPEGVAQDNNAVKDYELYYGVGENPSKWIAATTRVRDQGVLLNQPITGKGTLKGTIGKWDISAMREGETYQFRLKVTDAVGNVSCGTSSPFTFDNAIEIPALSLDKALFSPNGDSVLPLVNGMYTINENARVDAKTFKVIGDNKNLILDTTPVKTLISGKQHLSGTEYIAWDGSSDAGGTVPDGRYGLAVFAADSCGNVNRRWVPMEVDNTPPTAVIDYPKPGDPLPPGNIIEVKGSAHDLHFTSYTLEAGEGSNPDAWRAISSGKTQMVATPNGSPILGQWNTYGQTGVWTLRLSALDAAGNKSSVLSTVDLGERKTVVKDLKAVPLLSSPNNDGKLDSSAISYEVTDACDIRIEFLDSNDGIVRSSQTTTQAAGIGGYVWDGKDGTGAFVKDGDYKVRLTATLTANPSVNQTEVITLATDATPPAIDLKQPAENAYFDKKEITVFGTVNDPHLVSYAVNVTGPDGSFTLDTGTQNKDSHAFGVIPDLKEDRYTLNIDAKDQGENTSRLTRIFFIDRTLPKATLDTPKSGQYFGSTGNVIDITGAIVEKNLAQFSLRYGSGEAPTEWKEVVGGDTIPTTAKLHSWKVGKDDGVPDGEYTLSLHAKDKAELEGEARVKIVVDNTLPVATITSPADGVYVKGAFDVKGTISDTNLDKGTLEISEGTCAEAAKWGAVKTVTSSVTDGIVNSFKELPADGAYCLKMTARDKVGYSAESRANLVIDTKPPSSPGLTGKINESRTGASLTWTKNSEPDLAGYNLYRNNVKLNQELLTGETYLDEGLKEGEYSFSIKAVDLAGNESEPSNTVKLNVDLTGPSVRMTSPSAGSPVSGLVDIRGTAFSSNDFKEYKVSIGVGATSTSWNTIRTSPVPTSYGSLAIWDTIGMPEGGTCSIKLEGVDLSGNVSTHQVSVTIDNTAPAKPVLLSAAPSGANVTLTWRANNESDLAGYHLFRNDQLANAAGGVAGNLKPYLLSGTSYADKNLPDGKHAYYLIAMDQAGNTSEQSNTLEVELENRRPHAGISEPADGSRLEQKTLVRVESPDTDIVSVQFQYKKVQDSAWTSLGPPVTGSSFVMNFDPKTLGLAYGDYQLMATASDKVGPDPSPTPVTVTYTDLTTTAPPAGLKAQTTGQTVTLTWSANAEADLDGYTVYRSVGTDRTKVNASLLKTPTYLDENLVDNDYAYEITATDTHGNESKASGIATARVYAPVLLQPYTPLNQPILKMEGKNAVATASVELLLNNASGQTSAGNVTADPQGVFALENPGLTLGENRISATATDAANNASRPSNTIVVVYNETPSAPVNLVADVQDHTVNLGWDATNTDPEVSGYNIFRDGVKLNLPGAASGGTATASSVATDWSSYPYEPYSPSLALDGASTTAWRSEAQAGGDYWWEVDFPQPELINHLEIHWGTEKDGTGKDIVYGGKSFEVQAWSGYAWIPLTRVSGNDGKDNGFDYKPSYRTDRVRIHVTAAMSDHIRIAEVGILKDNLVATNSYQDMDAKDKKYGYKVTAVDKYGFESPPSEEKPVVVGDIIPPADPRGLTATASGADITLDWSLTPNTEQDLAGYLVYRYSAQGWSRITLTPVSALSYLDALRPNGSYTYRITAVDTVGNESGPSNEATAAVSIGLQVAPVITQVASLPRGDITVAWTCAASSIAGYSIFRSTTSGGPYTKLNTQLLAGTSYLDTGVKSGTTYFYVVRVVDNLGNESPNSIEASVACLDSEAPNEPAIVSPTVPGVPVVLRRNAVDVSGTADADTTVELYRNGVSVGKTTAAEPLAVKNIPLNFASYDVSLSPDGSTLLYSDNNEIWRLSLATGQNERIIAQGHYPQWFADGKRFGYLSYDENYFYRVGIYDTATGTSQFATNDDDPYEDSPSWSKEGDKVAFQREIAGVSSLWIKDFVSGELNQVPSNSATFSLSPDGSRLACFDNLSLSVLDLAKGTITPVSDATDGSSLSWSPDNKSLLYTTLQNDTYAVSVFDTVVQTARQVTDAGNYLYAPAWSPDGNRMVYARQNTDGSYSLQTADLQGTTKQVADTIVELHDIQWVEPGSLIYISQNYLNSISLQPQFRFTAVALESGANRMYVTSADSAGNISPQSGEITVMYDTSKLPDISVSSRDILVYPPNPKPGTEVLVKAVVRNPSSVDLENVAVDLHLWDQAGELKLLKSDVIAHLAAGSEGSVEVRFTASSTPGPNTLIAVADPKDLVKELSESNNNATAEFYVTDKEEILMTTVVAQSRYTSGRDVVIGVDLRNSRPAAEGKLDVLVEDEAGAKVAQVESRDISLAYGAKQTLNYTWNTGATFAGAYRIHSVLKGTTGILAENRTPFAIVADQTLDARVTTDKAVYGPRENVLVTAQVKNTSANNIIQKLVVKTKIVDSLNQELYGDSRELLNLLPGADASLSTPWNSGLTVPGSYRAQVQAYLGDSLSTTTETAFTIAADGGVSGAISVEPAVVAIGNAFKAVATITNNGNAETSGSLKVSLTDPESREILETYEEPFALPVNTSHSGEFTYQTGALALKTYVVTLQQKTGETLATLANTSVTIQDVTPPTVTLLSPEQRSIHHGTIKVQALVHDDASGVERTEYRIDAGAWKLLPATDAAQGKYLIAWEPSSVDSGAHTISCRSFDKKGNESTSVSATFTVQLDSTPPVLTVSTLSNGARTNQEALNITGSVHDDTGVREVSVNGEYVPVNADGSFTHALLLVEGENRITILAYDLAGNRSEDTRTITLDLNAPNLVVIQPSDNLRTGQQLITVSGAVDESCSVDVRLNGTSAFTGIFDSGFSTTVLLLTGLNHIEATATDMAGNTSSIKRTVFYDNEKPTLVITEPGQDISTNQSSITIRGNVGDNAAIPSVTMTFDGTTYTPAVVNGVFQQAVSFTQEKLYEIIITATDGIAGHEVSTQRNILYDTTKPVLTIDPVISPVSETSQVVTGTREERALVAVSCPTATVGEISYSTATTWSVSLTNLKAGANAITATSSDAAGNQATASASITVQVDDNDLVLIPFPSILWPPNHKKVPVLIAGWIRRPCHSDIESVVISVGDEYGKYNYTNLHFGSVIMLEAWRQGNDKDGRIYTVTAVATHRDGRITTTVRRVIVPHDLSKCNHEWDVH